MTDVVVVGAGLAGLAAARDLMAGGADVIVLEARPRAGGRVEQTTLPDGRPVQLGGEVVGPTHTAYRGLAEELGLTIEPSFTGVPGADTHLLADGTRHVVDAFGWLGDDDRRVYEKVEKAFAALVRTIDPDDPWSHPDASRLDGLSVGAWLRSVGATAEVVRARELAMAALAGGSVEQTSLLADLRKEAAVRAAGFYDYDVWESQRVAEGAAEVPGRMAAELGSRVRLASPVRSIRIAGSGCTVTTDNGERFDAAAVVCAMPVGPLRSIRVDGVSEARLASLRRQRHVPAAKVVAAYSTSFWEEHGQNGSAYFEREVQGGTWAQREGILSALVPAERLGWFLATDPDRLQPELTAELARAFGPEAARPQAFYVRNWALDPWTQGYITGWRPGDVLAVGPLHGTHEPPFYVCGSDQWVCGYMEGAVRTGRDAAAAALGRDRQ